jgi:hypothetical protein
MFFNKESKSFIMEQSDKEYCPWCRFNENDDPKSSGLGVLVVFVETLFCARWDEISQSTKMIYHVIK